MHAPHTLTVIVVISFVGVRSFQEINILELKSRKITGRIPKKIKREKSGKQFDDDIMKSYIQY